MEEWGCNPERVAVTATAIEASNPKQRQLYDFAPAANPFKNPLHNLIPIRRTGSPSARALSYGSTTSVATLVNFWITFY